jgi:hypothetical protein
MLKAKDIYGGKSPHQHLTPNLRSTQILPEKLRNRLEVLGTGGKITANIL